MKLKRSREASRCRRGYLGVYCAALVEFAFQTFANVTGGGVIDISGARFIHVVPTLFIYSVSVGDLKELFPCRVSTGSLNVLDHRLALG